MTAENTQLTIATRPRSFVNITKDLQSLVDQKSFGDGLCNCFIQHTSASLIVTENSDPDVLKDLSMFMASLVVDGDPRFRHTLEGDDDMSAHIRSVLTQTSIMIPICSGQLALGTWQAVFLWEHREHAHQRHVMVSLL